MPCVLRTSYMGTKFGLNYKRINEKILLKLLYQTASNHKILKNMLRRKILNNHIIVLYRNELLFIPRMGNIMDRL